MNRKILKSLEKVANSLDEKKMFKEANAVTEILVKLASDLDYYSDVIVENDYNDETYNVMLDDHFSNDYLYADDEPNFYEIKSREKLDHIFNELKNKGKLHHIIKTVDNFRPGTGEARAKQGAQDELEYYVSSNYDYDWEEFIKDNHSDEELFKSFVFLWFKDWNN